LFERRKPERLAIIHQLAARADIVCGNMMDDQMGRLGVDAASLGQLNPRAIGLQITATRAANGTGRRTTTRAMIPPFRAPRG